MGRVGAGRGLFGAAWLCLENARQMVGGRASVAARPRLRGRTAVQGRSHDRASAAAKNKAHCAKSKARSACFKRPSAQCA